jgi:apolipoprotein N-acyltransferase
MTEGLVAPRRNSKLENRSSSRFSSFEFRFSAFIPFAAAALSGLLLVACFPKIHLRGLVWVACLPLLAVLAGEKRLKRAFLMAYVCGAFFFAGSCYWFVIVMQFYGHLSPALAVVVLILFVIIDSTFFGGFGLLMGWAARRSVGWALALSPFLWVAMELARTYLITGFPWNLLGYAVQASGVRQVASVTGVYGLSFLGVATSALLAWALMTARLRRNPKLEIRNSKLESRPVLRGARDSSPVAPSFEFRISSFGFRYLASRTSVRPLAVLLGWLALLLLAQWRLAPPPAVVGKELAFLVQPNVPLDEEEVDAWAPWRDPTQLQQLVQFSVSAVERFFPENVAPGFSPAPGLAGLKPGGSSDSAAGLKPGAASRRELPGGAPGPALSIQNPQSQIPNLKSQIANPKLPIQKSKIQNRAPHPPLLIWAENPAPFYFTRDPVFRNAMENMARQTHAFVIGNTIIPLDAKGETITNSAFTLDPDGREVSRYDKIHLVPFGEYVPGWALPGLVHKITPEVGAFVPGSSYAVAKSPGGGIGVFICYEAIIPQLARQLVANGADVLVNISNDAWYGDSAAAYQHLEMARLRAIENHRYLLRATNNGLTTLIDPYGRVLEEMPRYERLVMPAHFEFETRQTFYSAHGDVFAWLCAGVAGIMLLAASFARVEDHGRKAKGKM